MRNFATQSYYDEIIEAGKAMGFRFVKQVQITTDDMPYYIEVTSARVTHLVFDRPDKAEFLHFYHNEHDGMFGGGYDNHWNIRAEYCHITESKMLDNYVEHMKQSEDLDLDWDFEGYVNPIDKLELKNLNCGWSSRGSDGERTFTGDIDSENHQVLCSVDLVKSILQQLFERPTDTLTTTFNELCMCWAPTYVFSGEQSSGTNGWQSKKEREEKLDNIFWERFGDARSVIRDKVIRTY